MRKFLIAAAAAASVAMAAAPAAAQYQPQPGYGHANPSGRYSGGQLIERLDRIQQRINQLDRRDFLSEREARSLRAEAADLRVRLTRQRWNGLNNRERWNIQQRIDRLEQRVSREARDRNGRPGGNRW